MGVNKILFNMENHLRKIEVITLLTFFIVLFVCLTEAQNTPSIGFISPDVITEIGELMIIEDIS